MIVFCQLGCLKAVKVCLLELVLSYLALEASIPYFNTITVIIMNKVSLLYFIQLPRDDTEFTYVGASYEESQYARPRCRKEGCPSLPLIEKRQTEFQPKNKEFGVLQPQVQCVSSPHPTEARIGMWEQHCRLSTELWPERSCCNKKIITDYERFISFISINNSNISTICEPEAAFHH